MCVYVCQEQEAALKEQSGRHMRELEEEVTRLREEENRVKEEARRPKKKQVRQPSALEQCREMLLLLSFKSRLKTKLLSEALS